MPYLVDTQEPTLRAVLEDLEHLVIPPSRLTILDSSQIGSGGYGEVMLAKLDEYESSAREVAVKQLRTVGTNGVRLRVALRLARELKIWAKVKHRNILSLLGYYLSENYEIAQLVSPFMINGNVLRHIAKQQPDIMKRLGYVRDITAGMDYLHRRDPPICHGDLKPANVLIADSDHAVLCDFGLASIVNDAQASSGLTTSRSLKGSVRYMSPELVSETETKQTLASDVWAWACTAFQILTDVEPYSHAKTEWGVIGAILQNKSPGDLTVLSTATLGEQLKELSIPLANHIGSCWYFEPAERPSIADSLRLVEVSHSEERSISASEGWVMRLRVREVFSQGLPLSGFQTPRHSVPPWRVAISIGRDIPTEQKSSIFVKAIEPGDWCDISLNDASANECLVLEVKDRRAFRKHYRLQFDLGKAKIPLLFFIRDLGLHQGRQSFDWVVSQDPIKPVKLECEVEFFRSR